MLFTSNATIQCPARTGKIIHLYPEANNASETIRDATVNNGHMTRHTSMSHGWDSDLLSSVYRSLYTVLATNTNEANEDAAVNTVKEIQRTIIVII